MIKLHFKRRNEGANTYEREINKTWQKNMIKGLLMLWLDKENLLA